MDQLEVTLSLIGTILGLIITTLTFLAKSLKGAKAKKIAEQAVKISEIVLPYIKEAEKFISYSGDEKKAYVIQKASQFAQINKIALDADELSLKIDELVALTKQVNVSSKETVKENEGAMVRNSWL